MFDFVRTHQRIMQILLLLLIIPSFVFFGFESFMRNGDVADSVAQVNGQRITRAEWDAANSDYLKRATPDVQDSPMLRYAVLDDLVNQYALNHEVTRLGLTVGDEQLRKIILSYPGLKKADGSFDQERYAALLSAQNLTPVSYEARLRKDLANEKLTQVLQASSLTSKAHMNLLADQFNQERAVKEALFLTADYVSKVSLSPAQIQAFYDASGTQFNAPETVDVEYLVFSKVAQAAKVQVTDAQIEADYKANNAQFMVQEERRSRHILISFNADKPDAKIIADTRAKAEKVLTELKKKGAKFDVLAKKYSDDPGSAKQGGELPFVNRGAMVKNFEQALFTQAKGVVGPLVQTEYGFHIIEVLEVRLPKIKSLAEVRPQIEAKLRDAAVAKSFAGEAEVFANLVYEQSDSLKAAADKYGLSIQIAKGLSRTASSVAELNSPKLLTSLFSSDALSNKRNIEAVEVTPGTWASARVIAHHLSQKRPLAEVEAQVRAQLTQQEARKLAIAAGKVGLENLKKQATQSGLSLTEKVYSRNTQNNLSPELVNAVMKTTASKLPQANGVEFSGGYAVFELTAVRSQLNPDATKRSAELNALDALYTNLRYRALVQELRDSFKAKLNVAPVNVQ